MRTDKYLKCGVQRKTLLGPMCKIAHLETPENCFVLPDVIKRAHQSRKKEVYFALG